MMSGARNVTEMMKEAVPEGYTYVKTDRNGTKHYVTNTCPKCGGKGIIPYYGYVEGGVCFKCDGSGRVDKVRTLKIMTPKYKAKLEERRQEKARKEAPQKVSQFLKAHGFNADGNKYVVIGETFSRKDELKADGARFDGDLKRWYFTEQRDGYTLLELGYKSVYALNDYGVPYVLDTYEATMAIKEADDSLRMKNSLSEYVSETGKREEFILTLEKVHTFETHYTYEGETCYLYSFKDAVGNVIVWKTANNLEIEEGATVTLKGTVKEHREYKGIKQTVLTRCKVL